MNVRRSFLLWLVSIVIPCRTFASTSRHLNYSTFENVTIALYEDVKFIAERLKQVNADAVFGLTLAQANLATVLSSPNAKLIPDNEWNRIMKTEQLCNNSRVNTVNKLQHLKDNPLGVLIQVLTRPEIWMSEISWHKGTLRPVTSSTPGLTISKATALIFLGTPQENESDHCLGQLLSDNCQVTDICANMLIRNDGSRGYPLTHRLLFVRTALAVNCQENSRTNFPILIKKYCQEILQDLIDLENTNFPSISRDLAMEQILLCGMEGYLEFINDHYANLITNWQSSYGCYSAFNINQHKRGIRHKKSTSRMDYGCDSHASGVAAATLSLFIREYVANHLNSTHKINYYD